MLSMDDRFTSPTDPATSPTDPATSPTDPESNADSLEFDAERCWGPALTGDHTNCVEGFRAGNFHFKNKFCDVCRDVLHLPASRMRTLTPEMRLFCTGNSKNPRPGVWKNAPSALGRA